MPATSLKPLLSALTCLILGLMALPCYASFANASDQLLSMLVVIIFLQTFILIGMSVSRMRHKRMKNFLRLQQKELEERVTERTDKLRALNRQLYEEIAKHEITEELLRETQDYLNSILHSMPSVLVGVTPEGRVTHWNMAAESITGISSQQALGRELFELYPTGIVNQAMIDRTLGEGKPLIKENIQTGSGSHTQHYDLTIYPLLSTQVGGAVIRIDDVTQRVRLENMMIQNEKMMSLGELAAGMAHEINNPLSAIVHGIQNIYRRTSTGLPKNDEVAQQLNIRVDDVHRYLQQREIFSFLDAIREASERSARIVTNMLEFSRSNSRLHQMTFMQDLLEQGLELARNSFELKTSDGQKTILIEKEFDPEAQAVSCSAAEIQQVVLNLLRNASQAFAESCPNAESATAAEPTITLRVKALTDAVQIEIEDNGPGMPESVRRHIFEPFFTTKDVGEGTGLGLSVTYFIITEHHKGQIDVESELGKGTRFIITLPCQ